MIPAFWRVRRVNFNQAEHGRIGVCLPCQNCPLLWGNNPNAQGLKGKWKSSKRQCSRPNCCQRLLKYAAERNFANNLLDESEFDQVSSYGGCVNPRVLQQVCFQDFFLVSCLPCFWPYHPDTVIFFISGCALTRRARPAEVAERGIDNVAESELRS